MAWDSWADHHAQARLWVLLSSPPLGRSTRAAVGTWPRLSTWMDFKHNLSGMATGSPIPLMVSGGPELVRTLQWLVSAVPNTYP